MPKREIERELSRALYFERTVQSCVKSAKFPETSERSNSANERGIERSSDKIGRASSSERCLDEKMEREEGERSIFERFISTAQPFAV